MEKWEDGKHTASDKRILITQWVGSAWEKLFTNESFHSDRYFEHTGCLLTLDGSEDDKVNIHNYKPPIPQDTGMDDIGFCKVVPTVTALEPQIS